MSPDRGDKLGLPPLSLRSNETDSFVHLQDSHHSPMASVVIPAEAVHQIDQFLSVFQSIFAWNKLAYILTKPPPLKMTLPMRIFQILLVAHLVTRSEKNHELAENSDHVTQNFPLNLV